MCRIIRPPSQYAAVLFQGPTSQARNRTIATMPKRSSKPPSELTHQWHLAAWAALGGKKQADAQRDLGWSRSTASGLWNGTQRYTQERVDEAARWLGIEPYELLMRPEEAIDLRRLRESAFAIAAEAGRRFQTAHPIAVKP